MILELFVMGIFPCYECNPPPPPPNCGWTSTQDTAAIIGLSQLPQSLPFEWSFRMKCDLSSGPDTVLTDFLSSFNLGFNDPCKVPVFTGLSHTVGWGHSHPWFDSPSEYTFGDGCGGDKTPPTITFLSTFNNNTNTQFSSWDRDLVGSTNLPYYMRIPAGNHYKVRRISNGFQSTVTLQ